LGVSLGWGLPHKRHPESTDTRKDLGTYCRGALPHVGTHNTHAPVIHVRHLPITLAPHLVVAIPLPAHVCRRSPFLTPSIRSSIHLQGQGPFARCCMRKSTHNPQPVLNPNSSLLKSRTQPWVRDTSFLSLGL